MAETSARKLVMVLNCPDCGEPVAWTYPTSKKRRCQNPDCRTMITQAMVKDQIDAAKASGKDR